MDYATSILPITGFGYPWTGTLQVTFHPDGIIQGYYRPADNNAFVPVTGGQSGDNVWIDIGQSGQLHVTGRLQEGRIVGTAFDSRTNDQYRFSAALTR